MFKEDKRGKSLFLRVGFRFDGEGLIIDYWVVEKLFS